jgi:hypothetical protein
MTRLLILAALAIGVVALILFDRGRPSTDEQHRATEQLFVHFDPARVDEITIERGGSTFKLERRSGLWWLDGVRADDAAVEPILSTLTYGRVERRVKPEARAETGVDAPRVHLTAAGVDLRLGGDAPGGGVYVARGDDLLVAEHRLLEVTEADFRARAAVLDDAAAATTVQIGPLAIERHAAGWRVIQPKPLLADPERVAALLNTLGHARADSFQAGPAPSPSANEDVVTFDSKVEARIRWQGCGKLPQVVRADGAILCFAADALQPLRVTADELREPHLGALRIDDIDAVDLEAAGRKLSLRRADHAWRITAPAEAAGPAEDAQVRDRLAGLVRLRARAFGPPGNQAFGRLRLAGSGDEVALTLAQNGHDVTATRSGEDAALLLTSNSTKLFDADWLPLRSRRVDSFRPDQVSALSGDGAELSRGSEANTRLIDALSNLHAESLQRRKFTPSHTLRLTVAGAPHAFQLGLSDADGCLLRTSDAGPAFVIAPATCRLLQAPFTKK